MSFCIFSIKQTRGHLDMFALWIWFPGKVEVRNSQGVAEGSVIEVAANMKWRVKRWRLEMLEALAIVIFPTKFQYWWGPVLAIHSPSAISWGKQIGNMSTF